MRSASCMLRIFDKKWCRYAGDLEVHTIPRRRSKFLPVASTVSAGRMADNPTVQWSWSSSHSMTIEFMWSYQIYSMYLEQFIYMSASH